MKRYRSDSEGLRGPAAGAVGFGDGNTLTAVGDQAHVYQDDGDDNAVTATGYKATASVSRG